MAERGALLKAQFLSTAPRKKDVQRAPFFRGVIDSHANVQILAGSRKERDGKDCKNKNTTAKDDVDNVRAQNLAIMV